MGKLLLSSLIIYEDDQYLVINKPPLIATLEDRASPINILKLVRDKYPDAIVGHRLDKETSGALVVAKNEESYRLISIQFENRRVDKIYHAILDGKQEFKEKQVDAPIEKQSDGTVRIARSGKPSQTTFNTLTIYRHHTLIEAKPITGRMHQIRIHLALLKTPICGDLMYGGKPVLLSDIKRGFKISKNSEEEPIIKRFALHAKKIRFSGISGNIIEVEAPYPKDFKALLNQLEKNS